MEQDREPPHPAHWQVGEIIHPYTAAEIITAGKPLYGVDLSIQLSGRHEYQLVGSNLLNFFAYIIGKAHIIDKKFPDSKIFSNYFNAYAYWLTKRAEGFPTQLVKITLTDNKYTVACLNLKG